MRYVFMDNFRGFTNTLLPLRNITFLVGENSTGKSSFLKLLHMFSGPEFWFSPEHSIQEESDLGSFGDIVSAWSQDKSFFRVGLLSSHIDKKNVLSCVFTMHTFENREGTPYVSRYLHFRDGRLTKLVFHRKQIKYSTQKLNTTFTKEKDVTLFFRDIVKADTPDEKGFKNFPKSIPANPPISIAISIVRSIVEKKEFSLNEFVAEIPYRIDLTWIAPIRTKPQRFYGGTKKSFSPEGDHTPFLLQRTLRIKSQSTEFTEKIKAFGEASGLFETIIPHSFNRSLQSPFEIIIRFAGAELNINNVGYGVSQVLPLIVEFLSQGKDRMYAVQQPEVHLHPRAQAALGDLVAQLAKEKNHSFILETHSDYLIDRCRLNMAKSVNAPEAQVIFFQRTPEGNSATVLPIGADGKYPQDQPREFRSFFIKEEMCLLEV